mmetsp:Transcript_20164/g.56186  ORF Transcript_20164/g.56186 Transcript_20164/m.56186 type:complete len:127 (-) Transcript_20164:44-424(-)
MTQPVSWMMVCPSKNSSSSVANLDEERAEEGEADKSGLHEQHAFCANCITSHSRRHKLRIHTKSSGGSGTALPHWYSIEHKYEQVKINIDQCNSVYSILLSNQEDEVVFHQLHPALLRRKCAIRCR